MSRTIVIDAEMGEAIWDTAKAAYALSISQDCKVDFVHNDQRYRVTLNFWPVKPLGSQFCEQCGGCGLVACEICEKTGRKDKGDR